MKLTLLCIAVFAETFAAAFLHSTPRSKAGSPADAGSAALHVLSDVRAGGSATGISLTRSGKIEPLHQEVAHVNMTNKSHGDGIVEARRHNGSQITFQAAYDAKISGRGVWKWNTYLVLYQRHFGFMANTPIRLLEIGVQSGGSIDIFKSVLGAQLYYYGMDINTNCLKFADATTTIYIGDQASVPAWQTFFATVTAAVDIVVDDGGHQAHQMLTTFLQVLPHLTPGGSIATEDIHGQNDDYLSKFLLPAADHLGVISTSISSVHIYPFVLLVRKSGGHVNHDNAIFSSIAAPSIVVSTIAELVAAMPTHRGATVALQNSAWPTFFSAESFRQLFSSFYGLHGGAVAEQPPACHDNWAIKCTMIVATTPEQQLATAVHIYPTMVLVEVAAAAPAIYAVRMGSEWIPYAGP